MKVQHLPIDKIHPYENNPRNNEKAIEYVANSIKEFGWQQPIVVDKEGVIVVGHTRYEAAKVLGMDEIPVVVAEGLTDEQVRAYRLADNKTGEQATWDWEKLNFELEDIDWGDFDMEDFGFSALDIYDETDVSSEYESLSKEELDQYSETGAESLKSYNVIICCLDEFEKEFVKQLLGVEGELKRLYMASELQGE